MDGTRFPGLSRFLFIDLVAVVLISFLLSSVVSAAPGLDSALCCDDADTKWLPGFSPE